jgi:lipopolysaccharide transport system ATP-binding protein
MRASIDVRSLTKSYRRAAREPYGSLRETIVRAVQSPFRRRVTVPDEGSRITALRDVTFSVSPGDVLGIIGRNGAGKSTLLKIISRITPPTSGAVDLHGRVGSLLEVGTGFHLELTGRENIYLSGAILGMRRHEIVRRFDEMVAFAEVGEFLDMPVKHYSSGMYMRLAFAVAAHLEPEIFLVDEVLAVGDVEFQRKCLGKMGSVASAGRTVLFVSHNMQAVTSLCTRALYLKGGAVAADGPTEAVVEAYLADVGRATCIEWRGNAGGEEFRLRKTRVLGRLKTDEPLRIQLFGEILKPLYGFVCAVEVWSSKQQFLAYTVYDDREPPPPAEVAPGPFRWELTIPANTLGEGTYEFRFDLGLHHRKRLVDPTTGALMVSLDSATGLGRRFTGSWTGVFRPEWPWRPLDAEEEEP